MSPADDFRLNVWALGFETLGGEHRSADAGQHIYAKKSFKHKGPLLKVFYREIGLSVQH